MIYSGGFTFSDIRALPPLLSVRKMMQMPRDGIVQRAQSRYLKRRD
jgi:hypothetical protein